MKLRAALSDLIEQLAFLTAAFGLTTLAVLPFLLMSACSDNNSPSPYPGRIPPDTEWVAYGTGAGITARLTNPFQIPAQSSGKTINYVYTAPPGGSVVGKVIRFNFSVIGDATFAPLPESACGASGCGAAAIRLFIWGKNSDVYSDRWWCNPAVLLVAGQDQEITCNVDPWVWTGVHAQNDPATFAVSAGDPFAVGFTFGAMFAGHGVWTTSGSAMFKVNSFTVQ